MSVTVITDSETCPALCAAALEVASIELAFRRHRIAAQWLDRARDLVDERWRTRWLTERAEAAVGCGDEALALRLQAELERAASMTGDAWTSGAVARTRALLADSRVGRMRWSALSAEHFSSVRASTDAGRALIIAAEIADPHAASGRLQLIEAVNLFRCSGAVAWEHRARAGLHPIPVLFDELTAGERRVAEAVVAGARNREVAERLCMSVRTVEAHLDHVYRKLGVRSRTELVRLACM